MFSFKPLSDEEIQAAQNDHLLPEGTYPFKVRQATAKVSQNLNPMIKVELEIIIPGGALIINDYLMETGKMIYKLKHFCESVGVSDQYEKGQIDLNGLKNKSGEALVFVQKGQARKDGAGFYADKNAISDYVKKVVPAPADFNDDIKF